jgi:hypothetical protein
VAGEKAYLDKAIGRYSPEVAATARTGLKKLRALFPGARQLVYDRRQSLPIGFAPEHGSPVFSLVLYPRWVGSSSSKVLRSMIPGPPRRHRGRSLDPPRRRTAILDVVSGLIAQALTVAGRT